MNIKKAIMALAATSLVLGSAEAELSQLAVDSKGDVKHDGKNLYLWYSVPEDVDQNLQELITDYETNVNTRVDIHTVNYPTKSMLFEKLMNAGPEKRPQMAILEASWLEHLSQNNKIIPVENIISKERYSFCWSTNHNAYTQLIEAASVNDNLYGLPFYFTTSAFMYDEAKAKAKGVAPGSTWQSLGAFRNALGPIAAGTSGSLGSLAEVAQILAWETDITGLPDIQDPWNQSSSSWSEALNVSKANLTPDISVANSVIGDTTDFMHLVNQGKSYKTAYIPGPTSEARLTSLNSWNIVGVDVRRRDMSKSRAFMFWLTEGSQQTRFIKKSPYMAAHVNVFDNPFYRNDIDAKVHANLRTFQNLLGKAKVLNTLPIDGSFYERVGGSIHQFFAGDKSLETVIEENSKPVVSHPVIKSVCPEPGRELPLPKPENQLPVERKVIELQRD